MLFGISISLIIVGVLLIITEIFLIPGFGVAGILGLLMMIGGAFLIADTFAEGVIYLLISIFIVFLLIFIGLKTGHLGRLWNRISLREKQDSNDYVAPSKEYISYLGKKGVALTLLRPAGSALIEGQRVDVVTNGSFISKDAPVKVIAVEGTRIIVSRYENENREDDV
ncbi:MAG: NfeD family protein [Desulfitobacteriia bacterium]